MTPPRRPARRRPSATRPAASSSAHAQSIQALALGVDRSRQAVSVWIRRPDWPFSRRPPWSIAEVAAWAKASLSPNPADAYRAESDRLGGEIAEGGALSITAKAKLKVILERARAYKIRSDREEGKLHRVDDCEARMVRKLQAVKSEFLDLSRSLAPLLEGQPRTHIETLLDDAVRAILTRLADGIESPPAPATTPQETPDAKA